MPIRLKDLSLRLTVLDDQLRGTLGRAPTISELAKAAGVENGEAVEAIVAGRAYTALSLSLPVGDDSNTVLGDTLADPEAVFSAADDRDFIARGLDSLQQRNARSSSSVFLVG
jgi:RNA polymerase sigma-B factor